MKAQSLRIGNYVSYRGESDCTVSNIGNSFEATREIGYNQQPYGSDDIEEFEPIPLTEEWLLKFGFSDKDYQNGYIGIDVKSGSFTTDFVLTKPKLLGDFQERYTWQYKAGSVPYLNQLDYVHELQNLFHALTGEELTLNQ